MFDWWMLDVALFAAITFALLRWMGNFSKTSFEEDEERGEE